MDEDGRSDETLEVTISARIFSDIVEEAKKHVAGNPTQYDNFSHYVRAALIRLNRHHREN